MDAPPMLAVLGICLMLTGAQLTLGNVMGHWTLLGAEILLASAAGCCVLLRECWRSPPKRCAYHGWQPRSYCLNCYYTNENYADAVENALRVADKK